MKSNFKYQIEEQINQSLGFKEIFDWQSVGGGSINDTYRLYSNSAVFFVKINTTSVFKNGFREEVLGLQFLKEHTAITPKIIIEGIIDNNTFLVLEWIETGIETTKFWENFGEQLAILHQQKGKYFGLNHHNYMGQLSQNNDFKTDFIDFFIENRLQPQLELARNKNFVSKQLILNFEGLYKQLQNIIPSEKSSALHGDLWSGNFICNSEEKAVFIDPAVYYGHREIEIAMTHLFGGFSQIFYNTYHEHFPLESGFNNRKDIYNLYPLLIHLNLFGTSYLQGIKGIVSQF